MARGISGAHRLGRVQEARDSIDALHALRPDVDYEFIRNYWPIPDAKPVAYLMDGLEKAGLRPSP